MLLLCVNQHGRKRGRAGRGPGHATGNLRANFAATGNLRGPVTCAQISKSARQVTCAANLGDRVTCAQISPGPGNLRVNFARTR